MDKAEEKPPKRNSDSIITTPTMRRKAKMLSRCFINIMKIFRMCKKSKKHKGNAN